LRTAQIDDSVRFMSSVAGFPGVDPTRPHPARIYDYGIGGKNHFAVDRAVADQVLASMLARGRWPRGRRAPW
jgi:S-adenosyl methyltransferase